MMARSASSGNVSSPLWFGTGIHFALEDWHGQRIYGDAVKAFYAYVRACRHMLPDDVAELCELAEGLLPAFLQWEYQRGEWETLWHNGKPLVEVGWQVDLSHYLQRPQGSVVYTGIIDRVVREISTGYNYILDYKTCKSLDMPKALDMDPQISAYLGFGGPLLESIGIPIEGLLYVQIRKDVPKEPVELSDGSLSVNANQKTTYELYKAAVIERHGRKVSQIPEKYKQFLAFLRTKEGPDGNGFFQRTIVRRTQQQLLSETSKVLAEAREMLNPMLQIYPNPTRDCSWDCPYVGACLATDDDADWQGILDEQTLIQHERHPWKYHLPHPEEHDQWLNLQLHLPKQQAVVTEESSLPQLSPFST
jgi:hypothetical protein